MRPSAGAPTGHGDRPARVDDFHAAHDRVGRRHGDGAHLVAADVLLHLDDDADVASRLPPLPVISSAL